MTPEQIANLTYTQMDRMSSDEYKSHLSDPAFAKKANELITAQPKKPVHA